MKEQGSGEERLRVKNAMGSKRYFCASYLQLFGLVVKCGKRSRAGGMMQSEG